MHHFPTSLFDFSLSQEDFIRFRPSFTHLIEEKIPTAETVYFSTGVLDSGLYDHSARKRKVVQSAVQRVVHSGLAETVLGECLVIPFSLEGGEVVAAVVSGVDPVLIRNVGDDWLVEIRDELLESFRLVRQACIDPETGLFNLASLYTLLESIDTYESVHLFFVELRPGRKMARDAFFFIRKSGLLLQTFTGNRFPVHRIGHQLFCVVCIHEDRAFGTRFGTSMVRWLRRENFKRVHVGCCRGGEVVGERDPIREKRQKVLDGAWLALKTARQRGPFSLYNHWPRGDLQRMRSKARSRKIVGRLRSKWQDLDCFSLVQFQQDRPGNPETGVYLRSVVDPVMVYEDGVDLYILRPGIGEEVVQWVREVLRKGMDGDGPLRRVSVGISCYPQTDFKKSELVENCRKALIHGKFFGPGAVTVFDHVSLNISGDGYYGEGDMVMALREYKKGLACQHNDVNLLNSLGVTYGMLDQHGLAIASFEKALEVEPDNYMALYNLGLASELTLDVQTALACFKKALGVSEDGEVSAESRMDLLFHLGKMHCLAGTYKEASAILLSWYHTVEKERDRGKVLRLLGEAYHGLGESGEAIRWLQRAVHFDEFDSRSLSLLGSLYLEENEGDEIALSLCRKSVELNSGSLLYKLRLAAVLIQLGRIDEGLVALKPCLRNASLKAEAWLQKGIACFQQGEKKRARKWFDKVLCHEKSDPKLVRQVLGYLKRY